MRWLKNITQAVFGIVAEKKSTSANGGLELIA
jgi:hypothetical protein